MESCEVLIAGGGPAGSACAWKLREAGIDVLLMDRREFPRFKPCAGWITPAVLERLAIDAEEYRRGHLLEDIRQFRTGVIGGDEIVTSFAGTVSYAVRRSEFDNFLLQRSCARKLLGVPVAALERTGGGWLVNGEIRAKLLVGAGGHFCPVARLLGGKPGGGVIAAKVAEVELSREQALDCSVLPDTPQLFFSRDMLGYGWILRKGNFLNIGMGRMGGQSLPPHMDDFRRFLVERGKVPPEIPCAFQGHAYLPYGGDKDRQLVADGALLVGDAAGLADARSGEGILPAIESGLAAGLVIREAEGDYRCEKLGAYPLRLAVKLGPLRRMPALTVPQGIKGFLGRRFLSSRWFTRRILLGRWFLHESG